MNSKASLALALILVPVFTLLTAASTAITPLDNAFGGFSGDGQHFVPFPPGASGAEPPLAEQADGRLVTAYMQNEDFLVARYLPDGTLDTTFGSGGHARTDFDGQRDAPRAVAIQRDGKIVVAGVAKVGSNDDFALARYLPNGRPDPGFGNNGRVTTGFGLGGSNNDGAQAVALDRQGRILAAGYAHDDGGFLGTDNNDVAVARYLENGALDPGFSDNGKRAIGFGEQDEATQILLQSDGKILVAGRSTPIDSDPFEFDNFPIVARLEEDGSLDDTFNEDGRLHVSNRQIRYFGTDYFALQADDKLLISTEDALTRWIKGGFYDFSFGQNGRFFGNFHQILTDKAGIVAVQVGNNGSRLVRVPFDGSGILDPSVFGSPFEDLPHTNLTRLRSGHFLLSAGDNTEDLLVLRRYLPDGSPDNGGRVTAGFGYGDDRGYDITRQRGGGYLVAAEVASPLVSNGLDVALVRFRDNGELDRTFGQDGRAAFELINDDAARAIAEQPDGKILIGGFRHHTINNDFAVWRFNADGSVDGRYGSGGVARTGFGIGQDYGQGMVLQNDGRVVLAGFSQNNSGRSLTMTRFNANGDLDRSFAQAGKFVEGMPAGYFSLRGLTQLDDGDLLAVGGRDGDFWAYRFTPDGAPDPSFGQNGYVEYALSGNDEAYAAAQLPGGVIVIAGYSAGDFGLLFVNDDGGMCLDPCNFTQESRLRVDFGGDELAYDIAVQANGRIILAGGARGSSPDRSKILLTRIGLSTFPVRGYAVDTSFGNNGRVETALALSAVARTVLLHDDRIVTAGYLHSGVDDDIGVVRYLNDFFEPTAFSRVFLPAQEIAPGQGWQAGIQAQNAGLVAATISYTGVAAGGRELLCAEKLTATGRAANFLTFADCPQPHTPFSAGYLRTNQPTVAITNLSNNGIGVAGGQYRGINADTAGRSVFFPLVKHNHVGRTTVFSVQNGRAGSNDIIAVFAVNGQTYERQYNNVPGFASILIHPADAGVPAGTGQVGSLTVTGTRRLAGASLEAEHDVTAAETLQTTGGFNEAAQDTTLYCPLFRNAHAAKAQTSGVQVQNVSPARQAVTFVYTPVGSELALVRVKEVESGASATFYAPAESVPAGSVGSVILRADGDIVAVVNEAGTEADGRHIRTTYACFPANSTTTQVSLPLYKEFYLGNTTGIQVQNVSADGSPAVVRATYTATDGSARATFSHATPILPGGSITFWGVSGLGSPADIVLINGDPAKLAGTFGSVVITSDQPVVAIANETAYGDKRQDAKNYEGFNRAP